VAIVLAWTAGTLVLLRDAATRHQAHVTRAVGLATGRLREVRDVALRMADLVAHEPAVVRATSQRDGAGLARALGLRLASLTPDRLADLVLVTGRDGMVVATWGAPGAPQLPQRSALPGGAVAPLGLAPGSGVRGGSPPAARVQLVGGRAHLVAVAPVVTPEGERAGAAAVAWRFDRLQDGRGEGDDAFALVAVADDALVGATRLALPAGGWRTAAARGARALDGERWTVHRLAGVDGVLALVPERAHVAERRRILGWAGGSLAVAAAALIGVAWLSARAAGPAAPATSAPSAGTRSASARSPLAALLAISDKILVASSWESREVFDAIAQAAVALMGAQAARVWIADRDAGVLRPHGSAGFDREREGPMTDHATIPFGDGLVGAVFQSGAPEYLVDVQETDRVLNQRLARTAGLHAFAGIPLVVADRVVGVLAILFGDRRLFDAEDRALMSLLADQAALAVHSARLLGEERVRRAQLAALLEVNKTIGASQSADELASAVADEAARLLDVDNAGVRLIEGDALVLAGVAGAAAETMLRPRLGIGEGSSGRVVREGRSVILDLQAGPDALLEAAEADRQLDYQSFLGVPLKVGERIIGVIGLRGRAPFEAGHRELAEAFAGQAAIALEHARIYREARRQAERMAALADVERLLSETLDPDVVARRIAASLRTLLAAQSSAVYRLDAATGDLSVIASATARGSADTRSVVLPRGTGLSGLAIRERRAVVTADVLDDPRVELTPQVRARAVERSHRAALSVPLIVRDRLIGALGVGDRIGRVFDQDDVRLAQAFADQAARALDNAQLFALETRRRAQVETLAEIERELAAELDVDRLLRLIVDRAGRLLVGEGVIYLADGTALTPRATSVPDLFDRAVGPGEGLAGACAEARRGLVANDYARTPHARPELVDRGIRHALACPLAIREELLGVILMGRRGADARPFRDDDLEALAEFATQAAVALDNARLHAETDRRRREAEVVAELARTLNASLDFGTVLQRVAEGARDLCRSDLARVALRDDDEERLLFRHWAGARYEGYGDLRIEPGVGVTGRVLATGHAYRTDDWRRDPGIVKVHAHVVEQEGIVSELAVPIRIGDRVEGVLTVNNRTPRPFTDQDEVVLQRLADQAAIAIQNARLYRQAREYGDRVRALDEVNRVVSSSLEIEEVLHNLAAALARFFDAPFVGVWVLDSRSGRLRRSLTLGPFELDTALPRELGPAEGASGWVITNRQPILWADMQEDPRMIGVQPMLERGLRYILVYPIAIGDRVLGAFTMTRSDPPPESAESGTILASLAAQAAVALDHARLYGETTRRLAQTRALLEVAEILNSTLDTTQLLKRVAIKIAQVTRVDRCTLERWDGRTLLPLMSQFADGHQDPGMWEAFRSMRPYPPHTVPAEARAIESRAPVIVADATDTDQLPREWVEAFSHKSYMIVPIVRQDELIGLLTLDHVHEVTPFEPWQVDLAQAIAGQLALSLENTRLYAEAQERLREATTLLAVGQALSKPAPLEEQLRRVARATGQAFGADMVGVYVLDERRERLLPMAGYRVPPALRDLFRSQPIIPARQVLLEEMWRSGRAGWSADPQNDDRFDREWARMFPPHSVLIAPTHAHGDNVGALFLVWWGTGRTFSPAEERLAEGVATQVGLALENAELARQREIKVRELSVLHELSRAVTGQLDREALLATVRALVPRVLDSRKTVVLLLDAERDELEVALHLDGGHDAPGPPRFAASLGLASVVIRTGRALRTDDHDGECARRGVAVAPIGGLRCWLGVPMRAGNQTLGAITLSRDDRPFTESDEGLGLNIADLAALALRSARLFEERTRAYGELSAAQDHLVRTEKLRALGEMASGVAHDFNNLLAAILGRAQLLLPRVADATLRQWVQVIERAALDGAQTVRRLQEFARVRRDASFVPVDLNEVVRDALDITEARWREDAMRRGVEFAVRTALTPVPAVDGDPVELREAMTNLILNAVDAMPAGGTLTIATAEIDDAVEVAVTDTGVGMSEAVRERIFDPFFTTKGPQGTGLGLSMTYGIISRHHATVAVESEEGRGSTFRLRFAASPNQPPASAGAAPAPPSPARLRCLVVDDEESVGTVIGDVLHAVGHDAVVLTDGATAIERFGAERFDVVFTDLAMPGVSGWQVARAVKAQAPDVPVFIVTGFGVELSPREREAHGVDAIFAKPLRIEDIVDALARVAHPRAEHVTPEGS
jgi:GAF domain-containing protein/ActR/RegA family two-component response regulator/anti-sigma regulatory factor (Ser/Thr protein kinase)